MHHHAVYLATIAVLIVAIVFAAAKAVKAKQYAGELATRCGLAPGERISDLVPERREPLRQKKWEPAAKTYGELQAEVDDLIARARELGDFGGGPLQNACASALRGGKRLRAIILLEVCRAASYQKSVEIDAAEIALAVEYLHAGSLVIDDLPSFDDDAMRRGKPSVHAEAGVAAAQMAALSLLSAAYAGACRQADATAGNAHLAARLCAEISHSVGTSGAANGQLLDTTAAAGLAPDKILEIARLKTAPFFELAFVGGWLVAGGDAAGAKELRRAGQYFGVAFQVADDIGDMAKDAARDAPNFANACGEAEAFHCVRQNLSACHYVLEKMGLATALWSEIHAKVWAMAENFTAEE